MQCLVGVNLKTEVASIAVLGQFAANSLTSLDRYCRLAPHILATDVACDQLMGDIGVQGSRANTGRYPSSIRSFKNGTDSAMRVTV
jgi:hypothetical protein